MSIQRIPEVLLGPITVKYHDYIPLPFIETRNISLSTGLAYYLSTQYLHPIQQKMSQFLSARKLKNIKKCQKLLTGTLVPLHKWTFLHAFLHDSHVHGCNCFSNNHIDDVRPYHIQPRVSGWLSHKNSLTKYATIFKIVTHKVCGCVSSNRTSIVWIPSRQPWKFAWEKPF